MIASVFAVHISDGALRSEWIAVGWLALVAMVSLGIRKLDEREIPRLGLLTAALFVASQIHFRVGVGSVHLLLNGLAGVILGPRAVVAVAVALAFQALLFAHGGLTTLGINGSVMGVPAVLVGWLFPTIYRVITKNGRRAKWVGVIGAATGFLAGLLTVALNVLVVWFGIEGGESVAVMIFGLYLPVILVEAIGTGIIVGYLHRVKPDWLNRENINNPAA